MDCHDRFPLLLEAIFPPPVRLAGDINAKVDTGELLESVKSEWTKLWPLIDLKVAREPQGPRTENLGTPAYPLAQAGLKALAAAGRHPSVVPPCEGGQSRPAPCCAFRGRWRFRWLPALAHGRPTRRSAGRHRPARPEGRSTASPSSNRPCATSTSSHGREVAGNLGRPFCRIALHVVHDHGTFCEAGAPRSWFIL
jgi:hypothetical protein